MLPGRRVELGRAGSAGDVTKWPWFAVADGAGPLDVGLAGRNAHKAADFPVPMMVKLVGHDFGKGLSLQ